MFSVDALDYSLLKESSRRDASLQSSGHVRIDKFATQGKKEPSHGSRRGDEREANSKRHSGAFNPRKSFGWACGEPGMEPAASVQAQASPGTSLNSDMLAKMLLTDQKQWQSEGLEHHKIRRTDSDLSSERNGLCTTTEVAGLGADDAQVVSTESVTFSKRGPLSHSRRSRSVVVLTELKSKHGIYSARRKSMVEVQRRKSTLDGQCRKSMVAMASRRLSLESALITHPRGNLCEATLESKVDTDAEVLEGILIRKPRERRDEKNGHQAAPALSDLCHRLRSLHLFRWAGVNVLKEIEMSIVKRVYAKDEIVYREGDVHSWMGILGFGILTFVNASGASVGNVKVGEAFGDLAALKVVEVRKATLRADVVSSVLILEGQALWQAAHRGGEEELFVDYQNRLKCFMATPFIAAIPPEVAYMLYRGAIQRVLVDSDVLTLGSLADDSTDEKEDIAAIVESGILQEVREDGGTFLKGSSVNEGCVLGMPARVTVKAQGTCAVSLLARTSFWAIVNHVPSTRDIYIQMALKMLPPSTFAITDCEYLSVFQGSTSLWQSLQVETRQNIYPPCSLICKAGEYTDRLRFFAQGSAIVVLNGMNVRHVRSGDTYGELNFLGLAPTSKTALRALHFCVVIDISRFDIESFLTKHPTIRTRFRDLSKLKDQLEHCSMTQKAALQVSRLRNVMFFAGMSSDFLESLIPVFEHRIYLAKSTILSSCTSGNCLSVILNGTCTSFEHIDGTTRLLTETIDAGSVVGHIRLICNCAEHGETFRKTVVAETVCYVKQLHRLNLIECLRLHPSSRSHFETLAEEHIEACIPNNSKLLSTSIYGLPFFRDCGSRFLYLLDLYFESHTYYCQEPIVYEDTEGEDMYILLAGISCVTVRGNKVAELTAGMCFGEMAVLGLVRKRIATIVAKTICSIRILSRLSLESALSEFPEERTRFESLAATRHRVSTEKKYGGKIQQIQRFFPKSDTQFVAALAEVLEDCLYTSGQVIMHQGDHGDFLYLIHEGQCEVLCSGQLVATISGGEIVGEIAAIGLASKRVATVVAVSVCFVQALHKDILIQIFKDFPAERKMLRIQAARRIQDLPTGTFTCRACRIFAGPTIHNEFVHFVDSRLERWCFFVGDLALRDGARGDHVMMLMTGGMNAVKDGKVIHTFVPGDIVGELAVIGVIPRRSADVFCTDLCEVYSIKAADFKEAIRQWPIVDLILRAPIASRLRKDVERENNLCGSDGTFLTRCALFAGCSPKFIKCMSAKVQDKLYMPGELLCEQGGDADDMMILVKGLAACVVDGVKMVEMNDGSVVGEISLLGLSSTRSSTLRAISVCLVQLLNRNMFMKYLINFPRELVHLQNVGAERLSKYIGKSDCHVFGGQALFVQSSRKFMEQIAERVRRKFFFSTQSILKAGTDSNDMYVIMHGSASIMKQNHFVGTLELGMCFGELAVLGIVTNQEVSVRAQTVVHLLGLNRWELTELLDSYPQERQVLLGVVGRMLREDLNRVSDLEIIMELNFFKDLDMKTIEMISSRVSIGFVRKDELVLAPNDMTMFVILQGGATVEVSGVPVRELGEGDSYGFARLLGTADVQGNVTIKANAKCCLTLRVEHNVLRQCMEDSVCLQATMLQLQHELGRQSHCLLEAVLASAPVIQGLKIAPDLLTELVTFCEECICFPREEILASSLADSTLVVMLKGVAEVKHMSYPDLEGIRLEQTSAYGSMAVCNGMKSQQFLKAITLCKVLLLYSPAFLAWTETRPEHERALLVARLEAMPRKIGVALSGNLMRRRVDYITNMCITASTQSIAAANKHASELRKGGGGWLWTLVKALCFAEAIHFGKSEPLRERLVLSDKLLHGTLRFTEDGGDCEAKVSTKASKIKPKESEPLRSHESQMAEVDNHKLLGEYDALAGLARQVVEAARQDTARLRSEAKGLRDRIVGASVECCYGEGARDGETNGHDTSRKVQQQQEELEALRKHFREACARQQRLLEQLNSYAPPYCV